MTSGMEREWDYGMTNYHIGPQLATSDPVRSHCTPQMYPKTQKYFQRIATVTSRNILHLLQPRVLETHSPRATMGTS